jgi:hypothetical protein
VLAKVARDQPCVEVGPATDVETCNQAQVPAAVECSGIVRARGMDGQQAQHSNGRDQMWHFHARSEPLAMKRRLIQ